MFQRNNNKRNISMILLRTKKKKGDKKCIQFKRKTGK